LISQSARVGSTVRRKHSQFSDLFSFGINDPEYIVWEQFEHDTAATWDMIALKIGILAPHSWL
jgi:hypothetical protein